MTKIYIERTIDLEFRVFLHASIATTEFDKSDNVIVCVQHYTLTSSNLLTLMHQSLITSLQILS